jgi:hypothetical protein
MVLAEAVVSAEATWKMNTEPGFPCPSRVSAPPTLSVLEDLYTPGVSVWPARSPATLAVAARLAASL